MSDRNQQATRVEASAAVTNEPALLRDFGTSARAQADVSARVEQDVGDRVTVTLGATYASDGDNGGRYYARGNGFSARPSQLAIRLGNWALYGGYAETWWGPGEDGTLLFSTSARPFPKVGFKRLSPEPIDLPVLRWLGPIRFDAFAGVLDEEREFSNPGVIGIRIGFEPVRGFEFSLNRALQLCGRGRPCSIGTISKALIGIGNEDNTGTFNEPGNQIAGFDFSYTHMIGRTGTAMKLYFEAEAEDEDNIIIEQFARQGGIKFTGALGRDGASWAAGIEYTDTLASKFFGGRKYPGSMYNQFIYTDGFTYQRRPIGYSLDGDTRVLTLHGNVIDQRNRRWYASFRSIDLNLTARPSYRISAVREKINLGTVGVEWPAAWGDFRVEARLQDNAPDTPASRPLRAQVEAGWTTRF